MQRVRDGGGGAFIRTIAKLEEVGVGANSARPIPRREDAALGTYLKRPGLRGFCAVIFNCPTMKNSCMRRRRATTRCATTSALAAEENTCGMSRRDDKSPDMSKSAMHSCFWGWSPTDDAGGPRHGEGMFRAQMNERWRAKRGVYVGISTLLRTAGRALGGALLVKFPSKTGQG